MWMAGNKQTAMSQTSETTQPPQQPFPWLSLCVQIRTDLSLIPEYNLLSITGVWLYVGKSISDSLQLPEACKAPTLKSQRYSECFEGQLDCPSPEQ